VNQGRFIGIDVGGTKIATAVLQDGEFELSEPLPTRLDGDFENARTALRRATLIAPKDWRGWHALGRLMADAEAGAGTSWD